MPDTKTTTKYEQGPDKADKVWTDEERAAMQASAKERKAAAKRSPEDERAAGEAEIQAKIADMPEPDKSMAERIHALVTATAPDLVPKTYYGMPAYAKDGKTICFFKPDVEVQGAATRRSASSRTPRSTTATCWPVAFAVAKLTPAVEKRIAELVKKAGG